MKNYYETFCTLNYADKWVSPGELKHQRLDFSLFKKSHRRLLLEIWTLFVHYIHILDIKNLRVRFFDQKIVWLHL